MRVTVGVSGGIAAYKAAELVRALQRQALEVHVRTGAEAGDGWEPRHRPEAARVPAQLSGKAPLGR